jgi:hypothetical protein
LIGNALYADKETEENSSNMVHSVSSAAPLQAIAQPAAVSKQPSPATPKAAPAAAPADTVQISSAAVAALKEAQETPAQTAKEAAGGDIQAKRLLAKEAADEKQ